MGEVRPTLYLDKGALGVFDLHKVSAHFQICYSEATLLDLLNDKSGVRDAELNALNEIRAVYLFSNRIKFSLPMPMPKR